MKNLFVGSLILVSLFVGCKSSGGICCKGQGEQEQEREQPQTPVAVIDNRTIEIDVYPALTLSGARSYDRDESNQSIVKWDWNITSYDYYNVIVTDSDCTKEANTTDVNVTYNSINCQNATYTIAILTVTDDENQTNEKNITVPRYY